jgi:hypothetical protein
MGDSGNEVNNRLTQYSNRFSSIINEFNNKIMFLEKVVESYKNSDSNLKNNVEDILNN